MRASNAITAAVGMMIISALATAHPPDASGNHHEAIVHQGLLAPARAWTNTKTSQVINGSFLAAKIVGGTLNISIEEDDGRVTEVPITDLSKTDQAEAARSIGRVEAIQAAALTATQPQPGPEGVSPRPAQAAVFDAFAPHVKTRWDDRWIYIESDGLPHDPQRKDVVSAYSHPMMVGITAWQQQVPLPQAYVGDNAWRLPRSPEMADKPISAKEQLFRGAIAIAANGIPIFNPIKNDGRTDTFLAGELDDFGGHCGRADDYHYHIAPSHLQKYVGKGAPIAYALDGFPIYGVFDAKAKAGTEAACPLGSHQALDGLNGHFAPAPAGSEKSATELYHYHASSTYPYINGGMRGKVSVKDDQIDPQPRAYSPRQALPPLRGAKITGFSHPKDNAWSLEYSLNAQNHFVNYRIEDGSFIFDFVEPDGSIKTDSYSEARQRREPREGAGEGRKPREGGGRQPREARPIPESPANTDAIPSTSSRNGFKASSADVVDGVLAIECTCDGMGRMPTITWDKPPVGTKAFAAVMHHIPPDGDAHVYFIVANLPSSARKLSADTTAEGVWGQNTVNRKRQYAPPCSQGPGEKEYTVTLYALSDAVKVPATGSFTRDDLLAAVKDTTLTTATIQMKYTRPEGDARRDDVPSKQDGRRRGQGKRRQDERSEKPENGSQEPRGLLAQMTSFQTDVPTRPFDFILARPDFTSISVSVACYEPEPREGMIEYRLVGSSQLLHTETSAFSTARPVLFTLTNLRPDAQYEYRLKHRSAFKTDSRSETHQSPPASSDFTSTEFMSFHTRRSPGERDSEFTFTVQADSHLDQAVDTRVYERTLANMLADKPDFVIDLGDTFMSDKRGRDYESALPQYDAQRYYFSRVAHSAPLFMALGNHDGEKGTSGRDGNDIGPWSYRQRTSRFPEPLIDGKMYTGATGFSDGVGSNYYAFEWGDALFIILDPFWSTTDRIRGGGAGKGGSRDGSPQPQKEREPIQPVDSSWTSTLGKTQFDWLESTLKNTKAKHRFVFIHHLVGGVGGIESRGGMESSSFFEWGGKNADGTPGFAEHRAGWSMPIHDLLVRHHVTAVFHGHDHLFVKAERDGVVYQCVPQPGNPRGNTRSAAEYGYKAGVIMGSPGYLRVRVTPTQATVEFVRSSVAATPEQRQAGEKAAENGVVAYKYVTQEE